MKVIFLDIDGVINHDALRDEFGIDVIGPEQVFHLVRVLVETGSKIVLSSDWRHDVHGGIPALIGHIERCAGKTEASIIAERIIGRTSDMIDMMANEAITKLGG